MQASTATAIEVLNDADIPVMPMHTIESLMDDPHLKAVGFLREVEHPTEGRFVEIAAPSTWTKTQPGVQRQAPRVGENGRELLAELGDASAQIDALAAAGVTAFPEPA